MRRLTQTEQSYTVAEFEKLPESYQRVELIDGKLIEKPVLKYRHGHTAKIILKEFLRFDPDEQTGAMNPEVSVYIRDNYSPAPDLSFWLAPRVPPLDIVTAPRPDLAIEIQSPDQSAANLMRKAQEYIKAGVQIVWVIEPTKKIAAVFRQGQAKHATVQSDGLLSGEHLIPGFQIELSKLFEG